ncbi:MAG: NUDIX domain-containing protein [Gammaproteobacteria bacterium]|nr:NUDIX domain-containing protein [Gammaproteobacteria bacterium]MDH5799777.1 NUDIX domain-containing protein [Gammaproteobacteria bacterium]
MKFCPKCGHELSTEIIDNVNRHVCTNHECKNILWNNPIPVVAALVELDGHYVIARNRAWPEGIFSVITGYLEQSECPQEAVVREVKEELGLEGRVKRLIGNYMFKEKNQIILCYEVIATGAIVLNHELAQSKTLSPAELASYDFSPLYITQNIIEDWKRG